MKLLLVGGGGREHALAHKLSQSAALERIYVAPGNGGTANLPKCENVGLEAGQFEELIAFACQHALDLTVVGPETPLVDGIVDAFQAAGLRIFGPSRRAAQLEGSKAFAKQCMLRWGVPTGRAESFTDFDEAMRHLRMLDRVPVIKASGLAAGRGTLLPNTMEAAAVAVHELLIDRRFGDAGTTVLVEQRLRGPEVSVLAFCDGQRCLLMPAAQDYKRLNDGDRGPNTAGLGAFAPSPLLTSEQLAEIQHKIFAPVLAGLAAEGAPYRGVLYAGLMLTEKGPAVLEFNCRFGDPEAQAILPLLESDLLEVLLACTAGTLETVTPRWRAAAAVSVVMASEGYPETCRTGIEIFGVAAAEQTGCTVDQAGTRQKGGRLLVAGGRVLTVTATARSVEQAARRAYAAVEKIRFAGAHYRTDIGRALPARSSRTPERAARGKRSETHPPPRLAGKYPAPRKPTRPHRPAQETP
ncbi:MAG: phosphoribosylamine--glycine ligase [Caldilinea sp.]|jgi:phosphoribosylamine--glycine ligase|nr:phosphoribosylamine--glycine ligase [Caldilinea sp.]